MATQQTETLRGNERIQQLLQEFPEATLRQVVSEDLSREMIKPNETSRQLGRWALPNAPDFFDRNQEGIRKAAEKTEAYYLTPIAGYFGDGERFQYGVDSRSPYEVRYEERGRYRLYRDGEPVEEVFFPPRPQWYDKKTSSGKPMPSVMFGLYEAYVLVGASAYCEYWKDGNGCRYCNINVSDEVNKELGVTTLITKRDQDVYETMLAACQESTIRHASASGGVFLDSSKEADHYARIVRVLRQAEKDAGYQTPMPLNVTCQAMEPEDALRLKEAGVDHLRFNIEVWDPKLFEWICPGKAKYVGRERWLERLVHAAEIFEDKDGVSTNFIQGLEMMEPYGFKTEDEGVASYLEGCEWLLEHGVIPTGYPLRCVPGREFAGRYPPRTEYHLRLLLGRNKLCSKYKLGPGIFKADPFQAHMPGEASHRPHGK